MHSIATTGLWAIFFIIVFCVLAIDAIILGKRDPHTVTLREACSWTAVWISCALIFNVVLWLSLKQTQGSVVATQKSLEFFTGYLIEETLSVDNMFVILMIFNFFAVPPEYQRRVFLYGIAGAIIMRFAMIFAGVWVINQFHWVLYIFGLFLIYSGFRMFFFRGSRKRPSKKRVVYLVEAAFPFNRTIPWRTIFNSAKCKMVCNTFACHFNFCRNQRFDFCVG